MIDRHWDVDNAILTVRPEAPLAASDFAELARIVDPTIEQGHDVAGLIIDAPNFPGWDSFGALVSHLRFVHDHHKHVQQIAVVTDSPVAGIAEHLVSHFVAADIRKFPAGRLDQAREWITGAAAAS